MTTRKGQLAKLDGDGIVFVCNENPAFKVKNTGEVVHASKVKRRYVAGYAGDFGDAVYSYGPSFWIKSERLSDPGFKWDKGTEGLRNMQLTERDPFGAD